MQLMNAPLKCPTSNNHIPPTLQIAQETIRNRGGNWIYETSELVQNRLGCWIRTRLLSAHVTPLRQQLVTKGKTLKPILNLKEVFPGELFKR